MPFPVWWRDRERMLERGRVLMEGMIDGKEYKYPHCNSEVLHAPGECVYCDAYPTRQRVRAASGTPFTPKMSNGWSGNVAVQAGEVHSHMGMEYVVGEREFVPSWDTGGLMWCDRAPRGFVCRLPYGHDGPCPAYARLWKKVQLWIRNGVWWP